MTTRTIFTTILSAVALTATADNLRIATPNTELLLSGEQGRQLNFVYYGHRLSTADEQALEAVETKTDAYPAYGMFELTERAIAATHCDGNQTLRLTYSGSSQTQDGGATTTIVTLRDEYYPFTVKLCYKTYTDADVIEQWAEISHTEKKAVLLRQYASGYLPILRGNVWLTQFGPNENNDEFDLATERLIGGMRVIKNLDGIRNTRTCNPDVMFSLDGEPQENSGRVIAATLCYSGPYKVRIDTEKDSYHHFFSGINEENATYTLQPKEIFRTPVLAYTYSTEGQGGASRNFHRWARSHSLAHGHQLRNTLLNSWEGVGLDTYEPVMKQMMDDAAGLGLEQFVMDDGWFGNACPRNDTSTGLGDWYPNPQKLPSGVGALTDYARQKGLKFGIWIEPEMVNTQSELYRAHPDWIVKAPHREMIYGRGHTQAVLDLSKPEVQDHVFGVVDRLMTDNPDIAYMKWDCNTAIQNQGSEYSLAGRQPHLYIEYHRGLAKVLDRVRAKYPDLTIQLCAGGGGRVNYGLLKYFDGFWTSDNTDAYQRVFIQYGASYFYPAVAMAAHVSAAPNGSTGRQVPLKYRIDVAMSGRMGFELQPKHMTDEDKATSRRAIADYKSIREVVQQGDLYRLVSPFKATGQASLMYVSPDKSRAAWFWYMTEFRRGQHYARVPLTGLARDKRYRVRELNPSANAPLAIDGQVFGGGYLIDNGLPIPDNFRVYQSAGGFASRVVALEEVK